MNQILDNDVERPSVVAELPAELDEIVLRALALEMDTRYQSVAELRDDLEELRDSQ